MTDTAPALSTPDPADPDSRAQAITRGTTSASGPGDMTPHPYRVVRNEQVTPDVITLELAPEDVPVASGTPGQFNMLWAFGIGESAISMSALPDSGNLIHTIRKVGRVTNVLGATRPGDFVGVRGPFGRGWPVERARGKDLVIVAGGVGLAPLRPVLHEVLTHRDSYGRVDLVIGARDVHELLFRTEIDRWWRERWISVRTTVDHACSHWTGSVGIVTQELRRVPIDPDNTLAMVCGPEVMMRSVGHDLVGRGLPASRVAVSMERRMECGVGRCGHCQLQSYFICTDGPVFDLDVVRPLMKVAHL